MKVPYQQTCLLIALVGFPIAFASFCVILSRHRQGWLTSYLAYYLLFGCGGQWLLVFGLSPSSISNVIRVFLSTAAPAAFMGLAVALQRLPARAPFDTGALFGCYLYPVVIASGFAWIHLTWA